MRDRPPKHLALKANRDGIHTPHRTTANTGAVLNGCKDTLCSSVLGLSGEGAGKNAHFPVFLYMGSICIFQKLWGGQVSNLPQWIPPQPFLSSPLQVTSMSLKGIPVSEPVFAVTAQEMGPRRASIHESHRTMATTEAVLPQLATQRSAQWEQAKMPISLSFLERGPSAYFKRYHVKVRLPI